MNSDVQADVPTGDRSDRVQLQALRDSRLLQVPERDTQWDQSLQRSELRSASCLSQVHALKHEFVNLLREA